MNCVLVKNTWQQDIGNFITDKSTGESGSPAVFISFGPHGRGGLRKDDVSPWDGRGWMKTVPESQLGLNLVRY